MALLVVATVAGTVTTCTYCTCTQMIHYMLQWGSISHKILRRFIDENQIDIHFCIYR